MIRETKIYDKRGGVTTTTIEVTKGNTIKIQMEGDRIPIPAAAIGGTLRARMSICISPEEAEEMIGELQQCVAYLRAQGG